MQVKSVMSLQKSNPWITLREVKVFLHWKLISYSLVLLKAGPQCNHTSSYVTSSITRSLNCSIARLLPRNLQMQNTDPVRICNWTFATEHVSEVLPCTSTLIPSVCLGLLIYNLLYKPVCTPVTAKKRWSIFLCKTADITRRVEITPHTTYVAAWN